MTWRFRPPKGITIMMMRDLFVVSGGFYNQDWYFREVFANEPADGEDHFIEIDVADDCRGKGPDAVFRDQLPKAVTVVFAFFHYRAITGKILWPRDYTWCSDKDSNGDPIYVGGYELNYPGLEIHRHLKLRNCHSVAIERGGRDGKVPIL